MQVQASKYENQKKLIQWHIQSYMGVTSCQEKMCVYRNNALCTGSE